jgi:uncharacterized membrane protein YfcA
MLVVTFVCVWLGVTVQWPPVGIGLAVLAAPALVRAWWYQRAWRKAGVPLTPLQAALSFVGSLAVMALVAAAGSVAFVGVCFPLALSQFDYPGPGGSEFLFWSSWVAGGAAALLVSGILVWRLWIAAVIQRRATGQPPESRQRLLAFWHALLIVFCTLSLAGALGIGGLFTTYWLPVLAFSPRSDKLVRIVAYLVSLAGFIGGGWLGYRTTRGSLALAAPLAAGCLALWLAHGLGWAVVSNVPPELMRGAAGLAIIASALYVFPLVCGLGVFLGCKTMSRDFSRNDVSR